MMRLILLVALVLAATYLVEAVARQVRQLGEPHRGGRHAFRSRGTPGDLRRGADPPAGSVELVACGRCGVHTPAARALWHGRAGPFCSEACRQQAKAS